MFKMRRRGQCSVCEFPVPARESLCASCAQLIQASEAVHDRLLDLVQEASARSDARRAAPRA